MVYFFPNFSGAQMLETRALSLHVRRKLNVLVFLLDVLQGGLLASWTHLVTPLTVVVVISLVMGPPHVIL